MVHNIIPTCLLSILKLIKILYLKPLFQHSVTEPYPHDITLGLATSNLIKEMYLETHETKSCSVSGINIMPKC